MKFLFTLMAIPVFLCAQAGILPDVFGEANMVQLFKDGQEIVMSSEYQEKFDTLFVDAISGSRQMPAFAVAIHKLTMEDFKEGYWVKFDYGKTMTASKMPFDQLLIHIQKNSSGINVIRGNNGKFDGRCFYLDLEGNLDEVYNFISSVENQPESDLEIEIEKGEEQKVEIKEEKNDNDDDNEGLSSRDDEVSGGDKPKKDMTETIMPSVNEDKTEENNVIEVVPIESETEAKNASTVLVEAVSQWGE